VVVDRSALLHEGVDVGDRDEDPDGAAPEIFPDGQLVEVLRVVVVDRAPQEGGQVADPVPFLAGGPRNRRELLLRGGRELGL